MATDHREEKLRLELRSAGLRATAPRLAVLHLLRRATLPLSHQEVVLAFDAEAWDRATLYRNLTDLVRNGLARRTELGDRVWRYEAAGRGTAHRHPHFVCHDCGEVTCLDGTEVTLSADRGLPSSMRDQECDVQFKGVCDDCREATS